MNVTEGVASDLWWVEPVVGAQHRFLYVGHHLPISDDDEPLATSWFHSIAGDHLSEEKVRCPTTFLETWKARCANSNVYRSLQLFASAENGEALLGPFLIDIDNSTWDESTELYRENLQDALDVARRAAKLLTTRWGISTRDLRIFFTGRKGFNLEVRPSTLGIQGSHHQQLEESSKKLSTLVDELRARVGLRGTNVVGSQGTSIDMIYGSQRRGIALRHPYIRLHKSINRWRSGGLDISRRKVELQLDELWSGDIEAIVARSSL